MKKILIIMAMEQEARPIIKQLELKEIAPNTKILSDFPRFKGTFDGKEIMISLNGKSKEYDVDRIGTEFAALNTQTAVLDFKPDLIINAGTCGAFSEDAQIADIFTTKSPIVYHDHRIPIDGFVEFGKGNYPSIFKEEYFEGIDYKLGVVTTGCSLDMPKIDEDNIRAGKGQVKEMECASVASVAQLYGIDFFPVKSVTDIIDVELDNVEQFLQNLGKASANLSEALIQILKNIK